MGPGEYTIRIIPSHYSFSGGKYWLEVYATYDNHAHSYTQKGETVAPTCGYPGYTKYYCSCGDYTKKDYVDSPPHTVVTDPSVAPTCLTTGLTEGSHCSVCQSKIVRQETIPLLAHEPADGICHMCGDPCGVCGDNIKWILKQESETLEIYGTGDMYGWDSFFDTPWYGYTDIHSATISDGITSIGKYAFGSCRKLTSVSIPKSVTSIGDSLFYGCTSLTYIGEYAFAYCKNLSTIVIPANVKTIGAECFYIDYAKGLASIKFLGDAPSIGKYAFFTGVQWFTAYYPKGNSTYTSSVKQKYGAANITWNEYSLCSEHSFQNWEITRAPDCDTDGVQMHTCSKCYIQETEAIPALGHDYGAWKIHRIATTKDPGEERRFCSRCSHYESRAIGEIIIPGDFDGNDKVTGEDAIYLIWYTLHPKLFPLQKNADFTGDSKVTDADAVFLLWHCMYPKSYPLT